MAYYDTVVIPVSDDRKAEYLDAAQSIAEVFLDHGAVDVVDLWGSDVPPGERTSFPMAVQATEGETVAVGWIAWPSKAVRDAAWEAVMADPRMPAPDKMPFDAGRMIFGGFDLINRARKEP